MKVLWALFVACGLAGGAYWLLSEGYLRLNYPSRSEFPVQGIDVSHHQGAIDWQKVAADGVDFAFIKATEGGDFTDKDFRWNWAESAKTKIVRGAYHFVTFCRPVVDQLAHVVATIPREPGTFPPVLDLEFGGNCAKKPAVLAMHADLTFLVQGIQQHYGKPPLFYMTKEFVTEYRGPAFPPMKVWARDVFRRPDAATFPDWTFWQFAARARVDGISVPVDLNAFRGNANELQALLQ